RLMSDNGILVTYCAQGQFKRNLASAGFDVETLPGALGKKEMVRARKN
ncbi:MAG: MnmC family methyltransferase, partial [Cyclobacteriaceae bacterium]|nr:MnmC family methyltransferase [Cyclobacteriaceae bacterium]